jgi:mRNA interferase MazF
MPAELTPKERRVVELLIHYAGGLNRPYRDTDRTLIGVIPHTTTLRGSDLEIAVKVPFLQPGAFLAQNPITIPAVKAERFPGRLTTQQLALVEAGVRNWLCL